MLGKALEKNETLEDLEFDKCEFQEGGFAALAESLKTNKGLKGLVFVGEGGRCEDIACVLETAAR